MLKKRRPPTFRQLLRAAIKREGTQENLAQKLRLGRTAISALITGQARKPSLETVINLAKISPYPDRYFLWKLAGLDDHTIQLAAKDLFDKRQVPPEQEGTFPVPEIRISAQGFKEVGPVFPFPRGTFPNLTPTGYIVVDEEMKSGGLAVGDILLLNTYIRDDKDPKPFWGEPVLVRFSSGPGVDNPEAIFVGRIWIGQAMYKPYSLWSVTLWPWPEFEIDPEIGTVQRLGLGTWPEPVDMKNPHPDEHDALQRIRLRAGRSIVAHVIGWFGGETRKRNE